MDNLKPIDVQDTCGTDVQEKKVRRQLYLLEIFIDKVTVFDRPPETHETPTVDTKKELFVKVEFMSDAQFIFKENQLATLPRREDPPAMTDDGTMKWSRTFRVGKSYLFVSDPVQMMLRLTKYPLSFELWTDEEPKPSELLGQGIMLWDTGFFFLSKETTVGSTPENCFSYGPPLSMKQRTTIRLNCCCSLAAQIDFIVRLSVLGDCIGAYFQQLLDLDPYAFAVLADNVTTTFECRRLELDNNNLVVTKNTIYDLAVEADPLVKAKSNRKIQVCTELQSCGQARGGVDALCHGQKETFDPDKYPIESIKMGSITGPCGNVNCDLAHKIKNYIRNSSAYKTKGVLEKKESNEKTTNPKRVCGKCVCKEDRWHRDTAPKSKGKKICTVCGGVAQGDETCADRFRALHGTGVTPIGSKTNVQVPKFT